MRERRLREEKAKGRENERLGDRTLRLANLDPKGMIVGQGEGVVGWLNARCSAIGSDDKEGGGGLSGGWG